MNCAGSTTMIMDPGLGSFLVGDTTPKVYSTIDRYSFHADNHWYLDMIRYIQFLLFLYMNLILNGHEKCEKGSSSETRSYQTKFTLIRQYHKGLNLLPAAMPISHTKFARIWGFSCLLSDCWNERHFQHQIGRHSSTTSTTSTILTSMSSQDTQPPQEYYRYCEHNRYK